MTDLRDIDVEVLDRLPRFWRAVYEALREDERNKGDDQHGEAL